MGMTKKEFGTMKDQQKVTQYTLTNSNGMKVSFLDLGAVITNLWVPDRSGHRIEGGADLSYGDRISF